MYKRVLAIMLMLSCALYTACGSKGGDISSSIDRVNEVNQTNSKEEEVNDKEENKKIDSEHEFSYFVRTATNPRLVEVYNYCEDLTEWGKYTSFMSSARNGSGDYRLYVKYPVYIPSTGQSAKQGDDVYAIFTPGYKISDFDSIEEITDLSTAFQTLVDTGMDYIKSPLWNISDANKCSDPQMTVDTTEIMQMGRYEFAKHTGTVSFIDFWTDENRTDKYVAYITFTTAGDPVYLIVFDDSEDQHNSELIEDYARKMAFTLVEYRHGDEIEE